MKKSPEYEEGIHARDTFESAMINLFRAPKDTANLPYKEAKKKPVTPPRATGRKYKRSEETDAQGLHKEF
jgi:hypothetical protein